MLYDRYSIIIVLYYIHDGRGKSRQVEVQETRAADPK